MKNFVISISKLFLFPQIYTENPFNFICGVVNIKKKIIVLLKMEFWNYRYKFAPTDLSKPGQ